MQISTGAVLAAATALSSILPIQLVSSSNIAQGTFVPIGCKTDTSSCTPFTTFFGVEKSATMNMTALMAEPSEIVIPCDECISMEEFTDGENLILEEGMNIQGALYFPDSTQMTITMTHLVVEGLLSMHSTSKIDGDPSVTFMMTGSEDYHNFIPNPINEAACVNRYQPFCDLGKKAIAVAGGSVDIKAMPDTCPSWVNLKRVMGSEPPVIPLDDIPKQPEIPLGCSETPVSENFDTGLGKWRAGTGAVQTLETIGGVDGTSYIKITERMRTWQGAYTTLDAGTIGCLQPDETYLVRADIKIDSNKGEPSDCQQSIGNFTNCPGIALHWVTDTEEYKWKTLYTIPRDAGVKDGEWFKFQAEISFTAEQLKNTTLYQMLYFGGPEEGIDMSIDNIAIEIPPAGGYPDPLNPCEELLVNGDAELSPYYTFPWKRMGNAGSYATVGTEADGNQYFNLIGRNQVYVSIDQELCHGCLQEYSIYRFTGRIWAKSADATDIRVNLRLHGGSGSAPFITKTVGYCPKSSEAIGWVDCDVAVSFFEEDLDSEEIFLNIIVMDASAEVWYDDLSFKVINHPVDRLVVDSSVAECWDVGADILLTSYSMDPKDNKNYTITEMVTEGDETTITLNEMTERYTSLEDDEDYAVEVALLSREILFTHDGVDPIYGKKHGAHFIILQTPEVPQLVQGVEFRGMGQQGNIGRYPFHYHLSDNNPGSIIAKNTIRYSNQRCLVIHTTHNVTIYENIAFDSFGHCFFLEDGLEQDNVFERNLGALTRIMPPTGVISIAESDEFASTYWISNPRNFFYDNVAAGGEDTGFWYEFLEMVRGPSVIYDPYYNVNPSKFIFGDFRGQVIHSNVGDGFKLYPNGYFPEERATYKDLRSYRNKGDGVLFHNSENLGIDGGIFADNRIQIEVDKQADDVRVSNCKVIGYSDSFQYAVEYGKKVSHCPAHRPLAGVQLHSYLRYKDSDGYRLINIDFYNFGEEATGGCVGSAAIEMDPQIVEGHFDAYSQFRDLRFHPEEKMTMAEKWTACDLHYAGVEDLAIQDQTGDLNPNGDHVPGYIVSNSTLMTQFLDCIPMEGSCTMYCPNPSDDPAAEVCFRALNLAVSQAEEYADVKLVVKDLDTGVTNSFQGFFNNITKQIGIQENKKIVEDVMENFGYMRRRIFTPIMPKGNYTMTFMKGEEIVWPRFVEMVWERQDNCTNSLQNEDVELIVPSVANGECDTNIVLNGDVEEGRNHWVHTGSSLKVSPFGYGGSTQSISTVHRKGPWQGIGQFLDSRCFTEGDILEVNVKYRMRDSASGQFYVCDFNLDTYMGSETCPRVSIRLRKLLGDEIGAEVENEYMYPLALPVGPTGKDWNKLYGRFEVTKAMEEATSVFMFIERGKPGSELLVDQLEVKKVETGCDDFFFNRDFEVGDTRDWSHKGDANITITSPGYNSDYALKTVYRDVYWASMSHEISPKCLSTGMKYALSSMVRLKAPDGTNWACDPSIFWGYIPTLWQACPVMTLQYWNGNQTSMQDIGRFSEFKANAWNELTGEFIATNEIANADKVIVFWNKVEKNYTIIIDDFSVTSTADQSCSEIVRNGDAEDGNIGYWYAHGSGKVVLNSGGADTPTFSIALTERTTFDDGLRTTINLDCLEAGKVYEIQAKMMLRHWRGTFVGCDALTTNDYTAPTRCPQISIYSKHAGKEQLRFVAGTTIRWKAQMWNLLIGKFIFLPNELLATQLNIVINKGRSDADLIVDDLKLTPIEISGEVEAYSTTS